MYFLSKPTVTHCQHKWRGVEIKSHPYSRLFVYVIYVHEYVSIHIWKRLRDKTTYYKHIRAVSLNRRLVDNRFIRRRIIIILVSNWIKISPIQTWRQTETVLFYLLLIYYFIYTSTPGRCRPTFWHTQLHLSLFKCFEQTYTSIFPDFVPSGLTHIDTFCQLKKST